MKTKIGGRNLGTSGPRETASSCVDLQPLAFRFLVRLQKWRSYSGQWNVHGWTMTYKTDIKILSRDRVTTDGVWLGNRIYWTLNKQLVTTLYR
jgi:hypothetical protein